MAKYNNRYNTEENTLKNVFQVLNWSKRTLNDGIFFQTWNEVSLWFHGKVFKTNNRIF